MHFHLQVADHHQARNCPYELQFSPPIPAYYHQLSYLHNSSLRFIDFSSASCHSCCITSIKMAKVFGSVAVAVGVLLVLAAVVQGQGACNAATLQPCLAASKGTAAPTTQCCAAVKNVGGAAGGPQCLCSLTTSALARANGVNPDAAMAIPQKCGLAVPKGFTCNSKLLFTPLSC